ncbi:MAG: hypothetical protein ACRDY3_04020 [Acidimicrobiales bacterium]
MQPFLVERRLRDVHHRLVRARKELAVLDEQLAVVEEEAEEARVRSLVAETPLAAHQHAEVRRQADAMTRARDALRDAVDQLERRQDELLMSVRTDR